MGLIESIPVRWRRAGILALALITLALLTLIAYRL
jgi:hypothetical protein